MVKSDSLNWSHGSSFTTSGGDQHPWLPGDEFEADRVGGHGTHVAGSAAGATFSTPAETTTTCSGSEIPGCVGGCIDPDRTSWGDDLLTSQPDDSLFEADLDRLCPMVDCDDDNDKRCLSDDVGQTLTDNGGMAQGAKLAIFDVFSRDASLYGYPGNGLWVPCLEAGCKIHSMSAGADNFCVVGALDVEYDEFMYQVRTLRHIDLAPAKLAGRSIYRFAL